jgi:heparin binding hemagglutinin HbhA
VNRTDIPTPIYAAAGIGELAYEKVRGLPKVAARTAGEVRERLATRRERDLSAEWAKVRDTAKQSGAALAATASSVSGRAATGYRNLVARGERVVGDRFGAAEPSEPAKVEVEVGPVQPAQPQ